MQNKQSGFGGWLQSIGNRQIRSRKKRQEMHQLDVKVNSRKSRRKRTSRRFGGVIRVAAIVVLLLGLTALAEWGYRQIFFENSEFKLNRLAVETGGSLTESDIVAAARIQLGMSLMEIDLSEVQDRILELPMVTKATVTRELPDRLEISVEERVPIAWLASPRHNVPPRNAATGFLMDREGRVFRCQHLLKRFMNLPVVGTNDIPKPAPNSVIESLAVTSAIELIEKNAVMFEGTGLELNLVKLVNPWSVAADYNNGMEVTFGTDEIDRGLADLQQIVEHAQTIGRELATVNVLVERNIPVTFYNPPDPTLLRQMNGISDAPVESGPLRATPIAPAESAKRQQLKSILNGG